MSTQKKALITEGLGACLGIAVSSVSDQVARLVHFPGSESNIHDGVFETINNSLHLADPKIKIVSPFAASALDEYMEKPIIELRELLNDAFGNNPAVEFEFLTRGKMANILAVGTDGKTLMQTKRVPEQELLQGDLIYELQWHINAHRLSEVPIDSLMILVNNLSESELTKILKLPGKEKIGEFERMLNHIR